jgi:hypothetical protein
MTRYLPLMAGVLLIVGLTYIQVRMTDRFSGTNFDETQQSKLNSLVPMDFGDWHGKDIPVRDDVKKTAGAREAVSRDYFNARTGEKVQLWLIVGHARDVAFHTPDICYPASGFEARAKENGLYRLTLSDETAVPFWTNAFYKEDQSGRSLQRVFWAWYNPENNENKGHVAWDAPTNARWRYGNVRSLFKMYFTSEMRDQMETVDNSACVHFARDFLPEVEKALITVMQPASAAGATPTTETETTAGTQPAETTPAAPVAETATSGTEAPSTETPAVAPAADTQDAATAPPKSDQ